MSDVLDKWSLLDVALRAERLNTALSTGMFDKWAIDDPALFQSRFEILKGPSGLGPWSILDDELSQMLMNAALSGGPSPPPYVASAVHLGQGVNVYSLSLTASATASKCLIATSFRLPTGYLANAGELWGIQSQSFPGGLTPPVVECYAAFNANSDLGADARNADGSSTITIDTVDGFLQEDTWYRQLVSIDSQAQTIQQYVNDVAAGSPTVTGLPFDMTFGGQAFGLSDFYGQAQSDIEFSDTYIYVGIAPDISVTANRRVFFDASGKLADPATVVSTLGTPLILLSGNASGFANNSRGGGGAVGVEQTIGFAGRNGAGPVTATGAMIGQSVLAVTSIHDTIVSSDFEATISVANELQQTGSTDYTGINMDLILPGALTNASSHP